MECKYVSSYNEPGEYTGSSPPAAATEKDTIMSLVYSHNGALVAAGDRSGCVTLLEKNQESEYVAMTKFKSHTPEFDALKSTEIEEKINQISFLAPTCNSNCMLSTNEKTIKLWKVDSKKCHNVLPGMGFTLGHQATNKITPSCKRTYANAHAYHINSISTSSDGEMFLSADDLRINMWRLEYTEFMNIVDIKPPNIEDLSEVITSSSFHPSYCNLFIYSSSKGILKLGDLREGTSVKSFRVYEGGEDGTQRNFFSEIVSNVSDVRFSPCGRYIMSRDYLTVKVFDMVASKTPVYTHALHDNLRPRLCELYENECIFDKFQSDWLHDSKYFVTGGYKNQIKIGKCIFGGNKKTQVPEVKTMFAGRIPKVRNKSFINSLKFNRRPSEDTLEKSDFSKKVLVVATNPKAPEFAVATGSVVHFYKMEK